MNDFKSFKLTYFSSATQVKNHARFCWTRFLAFSCENFSSNSTSQFYNALLAIILLAILLKKAFNSHHKINLFFIFCHWSINALVLFSFSWLLLQSGGRDCRDAVGRGIERLSGRSGSSKVAVLLTPRANSSAISQTLDYFFN